MKVTFIKGKSPILNIFHNGEKVEKIDLSKYDDTKELHQLFQEKGFILKPEEDIPSSEDGAQQEAVVENHEKLSQETSQTDNMKIDSDEL